MSKMGSLSPLRFAILLLIAMSLAVFARQPSRDVPLDLGPGIAFAESSVPKSSTIITATAVPTSANVLTWPAAGPNILATVNQVEDSRFPLVVAYTSVTDAADVPLGDLTAADFQLAEDGLPVTTVALTQTVNSQEPLAVVLLLDISGSMQGKSIEYARQAATSFLDILGSHDAVELISFSDVMKVNQPFTTTKSILAQGIQNLRAGGDTALYDALTIGLRNLSRLPPGRKVAVLLTDGRDTTSKTTLAELSAEITAWRVPVFAVGLADDVDHVVLGGIARESGGTVVYAPTAPDLLSAYRSLADRLRGQYVVSFTSGLKADGAEHRLAARVTRGSDLAESQGVFVARRLAPWIDIVSPKPGQAISETAQLLVSAQANSVAARIVRVEIAVDGTTIAQGEAAPLTATLEGNVPGKHTLKAAVLDSAGNTGSQEVEFFVPALPTSTPAPSPTPASIAEQPSVPVQPAQELPVALIAVAAGLLAGAGVLARIVTVKRKKAKPGHCPYCGTVYAGRRSCPTCDLQDRRRLLARLREVIGGG